MTGLEVFLLLTILLLWPTLLTYYVRDIRSLKNKLKSADHRANDNHDYFLRAVTQRDEYWREAQEAKKGLATKDLVLKTCTETIDRLGAELKTQQEAMASVVRQRDLLREEVAKIKAELDESKKLNVKILREKTECFAVLDFIMAKIADLQKIIDAENGIVTLPPKKAVWQHTGGVMHFSSVPVDFPADFH